MFIHASFITVLLLEILQHSVQTLIHCISALHLLYALVRAGTEFCLKISSRKISTAESLFFFFFILKKEADQKHPDLMN